jgi:glutathionylspermidine synthase
MKVKQLTIDPNWKSRLTAIGYGYHTDNDEPYWIDDYYYEITNSEADTIYQATTEVWDMCLKAVEHVIANKLYPRSYGTPYRTIVGK